MKILGDVAVVNRGDHLQRVLQFHPQVRTVYLSSGHEGVWRAENLELIWGEPRGEASIRENGLRMAVPLDCYFNPRMSTERLRIRGEAKPGQRVLDSTGGVGGFTLNLLAAEGSQRVTFNDTNPSCRAALQANLEANKLPGVAEVRGENYADLVDGEKFDLIVQNLPLGFDRGVLEVLKGGLSRGGAIWAYFFLGRGKDPKDLFGEAEFRKVYSISPSLEYWRILFRDQRE